MFAPSNSVSFAWTVQTTYMKSIYLFILFFSTLFANAQNTDSVWFVNNYIKKEVAIPMRDGIKLFTSIYIPKDSSEKHPVSVL